RERAARMVQYSMHYPGGGGFSLQEAIRALVGGTWNGAAHPNARLAAIQRVTQRALADRLMQLAADKAASPEVRAITEYEIVRLRPIVTAKAAAAAADDVKAHWLAIAADFKRYIERGELPPLTPVLRPPPGDPFGDYP
ncbi:MAG TPA: hypothetical protein VHE78_05045, partial [Gemmatimonadaceae bacterium]|nr:hypothetical protein [Gemmatimonadaceae bacterium]